MKRVFGKVEAIFDLVYLSGALTIGIMMLLTSGQSTVRLMAALMALVLVGGDSFHLAPRIYVIFKGDEPRLRSALGRGKHIASITMTIFYIILWNIGLHMFSATAPTKIITFWTSLVYISAAVRIVLCLLPQNKWYERYAPVSWGIYRNVPFVIQGMIVAGLFYINRNLLPGIGLVWLAVVLSFLFYIPVVLWANTNPKVGMLMLPKTCTYVWLLLIFMLL